IMPKSTAQNRELYLPYIQKAMEEFGINTAQRQAEFLGQLAHATVELTVLEENPKVGRFYEGRKDLGNTEAGDGTLFRGRGGFQMVGRANYKRFGEQLGI